MSNDKTYNGWTNYETWCVNLWWGNCDATCDIMDDYAKEAIQEALEEGDGEDTSEVKSSAVYKLSKLMEQHLNDSAEELSESVFGLFLDLLNGAISEVNFYEIAKHGVDNHWEEVYSDYRADNAVEVEE